MYESINFASEQQKKENSHKTKVVQEQKETTNSNELVEEDVTADPWITNKERKPQGKTKIKSHRYQLYDLNDEVDSVDPVLSLSKRGEKLAHMRQEKGFSKGIQVTSTPNITAMAERENLCAKIKPVKPQSLNRPHLKFNYTPEFELQSGEMNLPEIIRIRPEIDDQQPINKHLASASTDLKIRDEPAAVLQPCVPKQVDNKKLDDTHSSSKRHDDSCQGKSPVHIELDVMDKLRTRLTVDIIEREVLGRNAMQINVWEAEAEPGSVPNFNNVERKDFRGSKAEGQSLSKTLNTHNGGNKISKSSYTNTEVRYESDNQAPQIIKNYNSSLLSNLFNKNNVNYTMREHARRNTNN